MSTEINSSPSPSPHNDDFDTNVQTTTTMSSLSFVSTATTTNDNSHNSDESFIDSNLKNSNCEDMDHVHDEQAENDVTSALIVPPSPVSTTTTTIITTTDENNMDDESTNQNQKDTEIQIPNRTTTTDNKNEEIQISNFGKHNLSESSSTTIMMIDSIKSPQQIDKNHQGGESSVVSTTTHMELQKQQQHQHSEKIDHNNVNKESTKTNSSLSIKDDFIISKEFINYDDQQQQHEEKGLITTITAAAATTSTDINVNNNTQQESCEKRNEINVVMTTTTETSELQQTPKKGSTESVFGINTEKATNNDNNTSTQQHLDDETTNNIVTTTTEGSDEKNNKSVTISAATNEIAFSSDNNNNQGDKNQQQTCDDDESMIDSSCLMNTQCNNNNEKTDVEPCNKTIDDDDSKTESIAITCQLQSDRFSNEDMKDSHATTPTISTQKNEDTLSLDTITTDQNSLIDPIVQGGQEVVSEEKHENLSIKKDDIDLRKKDETKLEQLSNEKEELEPFVDKQEVQIPDSFIISQDDVVNETQDELPLTTPTKSQLTDDARRPTEIISNKSRTAVVQRFDSILSQEGTDTSNQSYNTSPMESMHYSSARDPIPSYLHTNNNKPEEDDDHQMEESSYYNTGQRIRLGICAMDKKARSKPMEEILRRLQRKGTLFEIIFFGDECIKNQPIHSWPICDVLIAFFSKGYPLEKVKEYVKQNHIRFNLNDLDMQHLLQDRRRVYDLLEQSGIDVPRHVYVNRDGYVSPKTTFDTSTQGDNDDNDEEEESSFSKVDNILHEFDDHIEVNGITINKPFVEKPVNAEDHNISIYYPTSAGGGCKKLFRKVGNRSSEFYPDINEVRRDGSYIYEEFVETQGTDVKMYTVGPEYGHAEARKSPTVDGKVQRNPDGKEIRFPVILTFREKEIARRIVLGFKQFVCGFDILRVQEGNSIVSYVCDVNGWSFVKNSRKYYDDCAQILSEHIYALMKPTALKGFSTLDPLTLHRCDGISKTKKVESTFFSRATRMLLGESVYSAKSEDDEHSASTHVVENPSRSRHDDEPLDSMSTICAATTLSEGAAHIREFPDSLTSEPASLSHSVANSFHSDKDNSQSSRASSDIETFHDEELRCVVAIIRHGDRTPKQKIKMNLSEPHILDYFHKQVKDCKKDLKVKAKGPMTEFLTTVKEALSKIQKDRSAATESLRYQLMHMRDVLERWKILGLNRKLQIKPRKFEEHTDEAGCKVLRCSEVQLILKWGGNLTRLGEKQAINLGKKFRVAMYPDASGGGILRLHSTFRHDLKIKTSDEGRVMKTAAAFAKGLLELEGDLPPILVSLVHKEKGSMHILDPSGNKEVKLELDECKDRISENLQRDIDISNASEDNLTRLFGPKDISSIRDALTKIGNPRLLLIQIYETMGILLTKLDGMLAASVDEPNPNATEKGDKDEERFLSGIQLYKGETLLELTERWRFIYERLCTFDDTNNMQFDLSRIPDIHDNVRFDMLHNPHLGLADTFDQLYEMAKLMADCVVPQEYGTTINEKRSVGVKICRGLLEKIKFDLGVARTDSKVDMRYMINMEYSADLRINSMGRRVRTRLYFTSESHLHTVLNVLRFGSGEHTGLPMLSDEGIEVINETPELCYLTHIVMRVFEDSRREMANDPRRFRVEILFSPGATAVPRQLDGNHRDEDTSRFETAPLKVIGRDGLTCEEVESFFGDAIQAGQSADEIDYKYGDNSFSTMPERMSPMSPNKSKGQKKKLKHSTSSPSLETTELPSTQEKLLETNDPTIAFRRQQTSNPECIDLTEFTANSEWEIIEKNRKGSDDKEDEYDKEVRINQANDEKINRIVSRKLFWGTVAVGSFILGTGCLLFALRLSQSNNINNYRHSSTGGNGFRRWSSTGR